MYPVAMKLSEIAARLNCELLGDGEIEITGVAGMEHAGPGELTFLANPKYAPKVKHTRAAAILIARASDRSPHRQPGLLQSLPGFRQGAGAVLSAAPPGARHPSAWRRSRPRP